MATAQVKHLYIMLRHLAQSMIRHLHYFVDCLNIKFNSLFVLFCCDCLSTKFVGIMVHIVRIIGTLGRIMGPSSENCRIE